MLSRLHRLLPFMADTVKKLAKPSPHRSLLKWLCGHTPKCSKQRNSIFIGTAHFAGFFNNIGRKRTSCASTFLQDWPDVSYQIPLRNIIEAGGQLCECNCPKTLKQYRLDLT
ncbi:hypothetical protein [Rhizobium ruizarguesonis]|uniref:hypothetical protein n=1 Tax=Rhizobium ruizarguesonis TaxID=2081791 RepID=UPI0010322F5D|nr:hypothetical protein [Rhizobium ruizarguesonis]TAU77932.1 hypothetical protein ELI46_18565 [Rhizobium ruizarguesonis]